MCYQLPAEVLEVLSDFEAVFSKSKTLPPSKVYNHTIPSTPSAAPVNARPYRYSPLQKDEIERQVARMLAAGIIVHCMSPFASPVILVQKKDCSLRFCVDYRRLNELTIINIIPCMSLMSYLMS